jgi:hypothetical protein
MKPFILYVAAIWLLTGCGQTLSDSAETKPIANREASSPPADPSVPVDPIVGDDAPCSFAFDSSSPGGQSVFSGKHSDLMWFSGRTVLRLSCTYDDKSSGTVGYVHLDLWDVTGTGNYHAGVSAGINAVPWDGDREVQLEDGDCSVNLQATAETTGGPLGATFECKHFQQLSNGYWRRTNRTLAGSMKFPPSPRRAPAIPSCSLALTGAYGTRANGIASVYTPTVMSCNSVGADGAGYVLTPDQSTSGDTFTLLVFHDWSVTEFRGKCTTTPIEYGGYGERVVADLACDAMAAADGSLESIRGHFDAIMLYPPK